MAAQTCNEVEAGHDDGDGDDVSDQMQTQMAVNEMLRGVAMASARVSGIMREEQTQDESKKKEEGGDDK